MNFIAENSAHPETLKFAPILNTLMIRSGYFSFLQFHFWCVRGSKRKVGRRQFKFFFIPLENLFGLEHWDLIDKIIYDAQLCFDIKDFCNSNKNLNSNSFLTVGFKNNTRRRTHLKLQNLFQKCWKVNMGTFVLKQ